MSNATSNPPTTYETTMCDDCMLSHRRGCPASCKCECNRRDEPREGSIDLMEKMKSYFGGRQRASIPAPTPMRVELVRVERDTGRPLQWEKRPVADIAEAQAVVREWIEARGIGASEWAGGTVSKHSGMTVVGKVSYNGRFWPVEVSQ